MKVKVKYLGPIRALLNKREEEVEVPLKITIYEFLKKLSNIHGKMFESEVFEDDGKNLREGIIVTIDGRSIRRLNDMKTMLISGNVVALLPIFSGGG